MILPTGQTGMSTETQGLQGRSAASYGAQVGAAMEGAGDTIRNVSALTFTTAEEVKRRDEHVKQVSDARWANEQYETQKLALAQFSADPAVSQSEDVAQRIQNYTKAQLDSVSPETAPSPEAYRLFKENYSRWGNTRVAAAYDNGFANKINATVESSGQQVSTAITAYRESTATDKLPGLIDSAASIKAFNESSFRKYAPKIADKLNTDLVTQTVLAVMHDNPGAARAFLNSENSIDEQTRHTLLGEINQASRVKNTAEVFQFTKARQNNEVSAKAGNLDHNPFTLEHYEGFLSADEAKVAKTKDDEQIQVYADGNSILKRLSGQSAAYQNQVLSKLSDRKEWVGDQATYRENLYSFVGKQIQDNITLQNKDTAAFLVTSNPNVKQANDKVEEARLKLSKNQQDLGLQGDYSAALKTLSDTKLLYQGRAPEATPAAEKPLYLSKPQNEWSLLPNQEAEQHGTELNNSKPKEFMQKMGDLLSQYPDEKHQAIVLNDLVGKGKLNQQYQFAWLNKNAWWVDTYLGAVAAGKDISVPQETYNELEQKVAANPAFINLQSTMIGDNLQRSHEIAGFKDGVMQWAKVEVSKGRSVKDAVKLVTDKLINSELGFTKVNGRPLMLMRNLNNGLPPMTDLELGMVGQNLGFALQSIPVSEIDQKPFTALQTKGTEGAKLQSLSDQINARAFWQTGPDGRSVSLYSSDENNLQPFQVLDKKGKPFVVHVEDIPKYDPVFGNRYQSGWNRDIHPNYTSRFDTRQPWMKTE